MIQVTPDGARSPVCDACGAVGPAKIAHGRFDPWDLATGWACTPYPKDHVHRDGSTGTLFLCGTCNRLDSVRSTADTPSLHLVPLTNGNRS